MSSTGLTAMGNGWPVLPGEILLRVFQYLDNDLDICRVAQVCKHWHDIAEDASLREIVTIDTGWHEMVEDSLASLPKRCSKLATLDIRRVPDNCIQGLLASFISSCPDLQELNIGLTAPALHDYTLCVITVSSIRCLTIDAALLYSEHSYEALSSISSLESITFTTAIDSFNPYEFMIGLQIFFSRCPSFFTRITLPDVSPLSNVEVSQNLVQLICNRYFSTLNSLIMWPVKSSVNVLEALCKVENLENVFVFEAKFSALSDGLWDGINRLLHQCKTFSISHTYISNQMLPRFSTSYAPITELVCVSCEFDDDASLVSFLTRFTNASIVEIHLHYGISLSVLQTIANGFTSLRSLSLSDVRLKSASETKDLEAVFSSVKHASLNSLHLALVNRADELEESGFDIESLKSALEHKCKECDVLIEFDQI